MLFAITMADVPDRIVAQLGAHAADDDAALAAGADRHSIAFFRRAATSTYRAYAEAMAVRDGLKHDLAAFFDAGWDALLAPVGPVVAFPHDTAAQQSARRVECDGRAIPYTRLFEWIGLATSLHVPALAVPAGHSADRLPTGVQLIAPWKQEDRLLDLGEALDDAFGFAPPPTG
jgi:amidase